MFRRGCGTVTTASTRLWANEGLLIGSSSIPAAFGKSADLLDQSAFPDQQHADAYARVASGFRPGGPNVGLTGNLASYGADNVINYEIGTKADLFDRLLGALEHGIPRLKDVQIRGTDAVTGLNSTPMAGSARSKGVVLEGSVYRPQGLTLNGNIAYTDAYTRAATPAPTFALAGDPLPNTPKWAGLIGAEYNSRRRKPGQAARRRTIVTSVEQPAHRPPTRSNRVSCPACL